MSNFEVKVAKVDNIEAIENADAIELAVIADYRSVVKKGQIKQGSLIAYIPEGSVIPEYLLERMGLIGKLAGSSKNRVKAIRLRGTLSQGIVYPLGLHKLDESKGTIQDENNDYHEVELDQNIADLLKITKYDPPVPTYLAGEVFNLGREHTISYDIENIKSYPNVLTEDDLIVATEKIHGTCMQIGINVGQTLSHPELLEGDTYVGSKGLSSKGLVFKWNERNQGNVYLKTYHSLTTDNITFRERVLKYFRDKGYSWVYFIGEVFGKGIQDLTYGLESVEFRLFDIFVKNNIEHRYVSVEEKVKICKELNLKMVPMLYMGPFDRKVLDLLVDGKTNEGIPGSCIREGLVITPLEEMRDSKLGRVILKHVSADYILRSGNTTEFN